MGYAKERGKLEKLSAQISGLDNYSEKSFAILIDHQEKYSHTVRILKNKEPETFSDLYKNELQEVKDGRKAVKDSETDEARQQNFTLYKSTLVNALEKTIEATKNSLN
jgi:hypothetical protein